MARRFKQHLRPLFRAVDLSATRVNAPIQEAIHFLKAPFKKTVHSARSIRAIFPPTAFPSERNGTSISGMKLMGNTSSPTAMNFWSIVCYAIDSKLAISFAATVSTSAVSRMI